MGKFAFSHQFESALNDLIAYHVKVATDQVAQGCQQQISALATQVGRLQGELARWPIIGLPEVKKLRLAIHDHVAVWFDQIIPDLGSFRLGSTPAGQVRHMVARQAAHNLLYRAIEKEYGISELKALAKEDVAAAERFILLYPLKLDKIWRAVVKKAIRQRVEYWERRGFIATRSSVRQGTTQLLWQMVRTCGIDPYQGEVARRRILRLIDRAAVPERYRQTQTQ